ncbi:MAG: hypothetical protein HBSAPP02_08130 [Phycisphaerae bacterium]|nr:MAG: PQQ-binding-like beta-propeller repeat protein [Planctomycetia bacterium]GJQ25781.1 MAG: hypothetical protein HBSAPP02_08130 [Phycisphaerae bacterium]
MDSALFRYTAVWFALLALPGYWEAGRLCLAQEPAANLTLRIEPRRDGEGMIPPSDPDAESWLKRAADAAADKQWKLAVDTLSRVIEQFPDRTVTLDGRTFVSAAEAAQRQFAQWPPEGLQAYRLLFDPVAQQEFAQASASQDVERLRKLTRLYRMTSIAPEAFSHLVAVLLDIDQPFEALDVLDQLENLPGHTMPPSRILLLRALALAQTGQMNEADDALAKLRHLTRDQSGGLPADWQARLDSISRYVEIKRAGPAARDDSPTGGLLPSIELSPAVTPDALWQDSLPGSGRLTPDAITNLITRTGRPPVWQATSDGQALFVTCPEGVMARDLATLELLWKSHPRLAERDPRIDAQRRLVRMYQSDNSGRLDELSTRSLYHEYRGAITSGLGMVFVLEQNGTLGELFPARDGTVPPNDAVEPEPNSIRAFEARSGRVRWTLGRGGRPGDELRFAHFYSPPIVVGERLLATYQHENDFMLGVFDAEGRIVRKVLIGTADKGMFAINTVLTPCVDETTIYIPTAAGLLVALNRHDYALRWLAMYERSRSGEVAPARRAMPLGTVQISYVQPDEWLTTPPIRAGRFVLLAAQDCGFLKAFDRRDGTLKWSFPRGDHRYIAGCDTQRVFLAGTGVLAVDLNTGRSLWSYSQKKLTGRPALCGRRLFVPTRDGLETLDAQTGQPAEPFKPSSHALGNLFVHDGALYSVSAVQLAKFPDVERSKAAALAQLATSPRDPTAHLRLAGLATLDRRWSEALEQLDRAEECLLATADRPIDQTPENDLRLRIAHQRVEALLQLAVDAPPPSARELIDRAVATAMAPRDVLAAGLAQCDHFADRGESSEAFHRALNLLASVALQTLSFTPELRVSATVAIAERLQRWWNAADPQTQIAMDTAVRRVFQTALNESRLDACRHITDACNFTPSSASLDVALARRDWAEGSLENAVFHLERVLRTTARKAVTAGSATLETSYASSELAALVLLLRAYATPGDQLPRTPAGARRVLDQLATRFARDVVPETLTELPASYRGKSVSQLIEFLRSEWPIAADAPRNRPRILQTPPYLEIGAYEVVAAYYPSDVTAFFDPANPLDIHADLLPIRIMRQMRGVDVRGKAQAEVFWACDLEPTLEMIDEPAVQRIVSIRPADSATEGCVALLSGARQMAAVGLLTGRAAWPPIPLEGESSELPKPSMVQADGILVYATRANVLTAVPARMDASPLWRRTFPNHRLESLSVADGQIVAIDRRSATVFVLDPFSGRIRRQFSLTPSAPPSEDEEEVADEITLRDRDAAPTIVGSIVCQAAFKKVTARDVSTGRVLWERGVSGRIRRLLPLNRELVGVCYRGQRIAVVRASTGDVIADLETTGLLLPPADAVVEYPKGASSGSRVTTSGARLVLHTNTDDDPPDYLVACYELESQALLWKRNLGRFAVISPGMLRASTDYLPIIEYRIRPDAPRQLMDRGASHLDVAAFDVLDKSTGKSMLAAPFVHNRDLAADEFGRARLFTDLLVFNDRIVAVASEGYYVLQRAPGPPRDPAVDRGTMEGQPTP